jgi:hypothetical protein
MQNEEATMDTRVTSSGNLEIGNRCGDGTCVQRADLPDLIREALQGMHAGGMTRALVWEFLVRMAGEWKGSGGEGHEVKWAYKVVHAGWQALEDDELNRLGDAGWELVHVTMDQAQNRTFYFKRPAGWT